MPSPAPAYPAAHNLLAGRIVLVTAAAGTGIGFSTAKRAAEEGATVVVSDWHERRLGEAAEQLTEVMGEKPLAVPCDVRSEEQIQALFDAVYERHGRLDVLVNNAGLGGEVNLVDMTDEQWSNVLDITLNGTMRATRAALRRMTPAGSGVIVNNASVVGWRAQAGQAHYAAAKAGVMALTRCVGDRGGLVRGPGQRRRAEPRDAPVPGQGEQRGVPRRARREGGLRTRGRGVGDCERHRLPGQRLLVVHDGRDRLGQQPAPVRSSLCQGSTPSTRS